MQINCITKIIKGNLKVPVTPETGFGQSWLTEFIADSEF